MPYFPTAYYPSPFYAPAYYPSATLVITGGGGYYPAGYYAPGFYPTGYYPYAGIAPPVTPLPPDFLAALMEYLNATPTLTALVTTGFGNGGFGQLGFGGSAKIFAEGAEPDAAPPFLIVDSYVEALPGKSVDDEPIEVHVTAVANDLDSCRTLARAARDAIDNSNISPTSLGRPQLVFVGGSELGLFRMHTTPAKKVGLGKGGYYVYAETMQYEFWVGPQQ